MRYIFWYLIIATAFFLIGRISVEPKVITETKIEKIYALPEGTDLGVLCGNILGQKYQDEEKHKKEQELSKLESYKEGYKVGFNAR